ncbi:SRPBCC family protein [Dictyobacter kobayashii]|uniref:Coenzyme Q-binding protein COQ10 START domain-containing protein n=1 Tax=Dictyobacter kobayashii TaxID=2014872 RepID=A0A402ALD0_9CHLR|nr:SRPBCC family protein [Dictyobacter kobayashii]GCE19824.1 hypothetical protein KDK_36240 [Dictyobacter kobayashii]
MVEHSASVIVKAPIHQVYELFTHFNDFPKFMSFVKEVTYHDEQRSHWVVKVIGQYDWDAVNEDWIPDQQIGWRSTRGLKNSGRVKFRALGPERTSVDVYIRYTPPTGPLGNLGEQFGVNAYFDSVLKKDMSNFARMVEEAPAGALDPMSSHYLFHQESATQKGEITPRQKAAMARDPMMSPQALAERQAKIAQEAERRQRLKAEQEAEQQRKVQQERELQREREIILAQEAQKRRQEEREREAALRKAATVPLDPRHTYAAWARGLGDRDGSRVRDPNIGQDPMTARRRSKPGISAKPPTAE